MQTTLPQRGYVYQINPNNNLDFSNTCRTIWTPHSPFRVEEKHAPKKKKNVKNKQTKLLQFFPGLTTGSLD